MEKWEIDFEWGRIRNLVKDMFGKDKLPDMNAILFIIGIQELGRMQDSFSKEEKQDLMHVAVCRLLSYDGYYEFVGLDDAGWPHWNALRPVGEKGVAEQGELLKKYVIRYFREWQAGDEEE